MLNLARALNLTSTDTTYDIDFDFTDAAQRKVLLYLQQNGYSLVAYKGAQGTGQIKAGLPTWFAVGFNTMFGAITIEYHPTYKVYVCNKKQIDLDTVITMDASSAETGLGNALDFNQDGSITPSGSSDSGTITLNNKRPGGTADLTVGLACVVNTPSGINYLPFCAFTLPPLNSVKMTPIEKVALMAARVNLQSGSVQATAAAAGATLVFNSQNTDFPLIIQDSTYAIAPNADKHCPQINPFPAAQSLSYLNQS